MARLILRTRSDVVDAPILPPPQPLSPAPPAAPLTPRQMAALLHIDRLRASRLLHGLAELDVITHAGYGQYVHRPGADRHGLPAPSVSQETQTRAALAARALALIEAAHPRPVSRRELQQHLGIAEVDAVLRELCWEQKIVRYDRGKFILMDTAEVERLLRILETVYPEALGFGALAFR